MRRRGTLGSSLVPLACLLWLLFAPCSLARGGTTFAVIPRSTTSATSPRRQLQRIPNTTKELLFRYRGGSSYYDQQDYDDRNGDDPRRRGYSNNYYGDYGDDGRRRGGPSADDFYGQETPYPQDEEDDYYYNDKGTRPAPPSSRKSASTLSSKLPSVIQHGDRKIGLYLLGSGTAVTMLGISLFFNKTLMRLGNLLFIAGVPMTLGPTRTMGYFLKPEKARATICLALGIFLVFIGWPIFGIALELFGLLNLFGNMFPFAMAVLKQMPIVGSLLNNNSNKKDGGRRSRRRDDRYYEDDRYDGREEERYY